MGGINWNESQYDKSIKGTVMDNGYFKSVLLVEDEGLTRAAMKSLILASEPQLSIDEADGVDQAMSRIESKPYDLVFLDYRLRGDQTGLDLLKWMKERDHEVHCIMLSNQDDRDTVFECIKNGACGFISKASEEGGAVFQEALRTILSGRIYLPNTVLGKGGHSPRPASNNLGSHRIPKPAPEADGDVALRFAGLIQQSHRQKNEHYGKYRQRIFQ